MRSSIVYAFERYLIFLCAGSFCCHFQFFSFSLSLPRMLSSTEQHGGKKMLIWCSDYRSVSQQKILPGIIFIIAVRRSSLRCNACRSSSGITRGWNGMESRKCSLSAASRVCYLIRFSAPFWELSVMMCRRSCIVLIDLSGMSAREGRKEKVSIVSTIREPEWRASSLSRISRSRWEMKSRNSEFKLQL